MQPHDAAGLELELGAHGLRAGHDVERRSRRGVGAQADVDLGRPAGAGPAVPGRRHRQVDARLRDRVRNAAERESEQQQAAQHRVT